MMITTLATVRKSTALRLAKCNGFHPALANELYTGRLVKVIRCVSYHTPKGFEKRFTVRLHNCLEFDHVEAKYIVNAENWT
jgi:hypothetical protein